MKGKIIHPRLAAGVCFFFYLLLFEILEKITDFQFISKYAFTLCIIFLPIGIIVYTIFDATYDASKNDNKLFMLIGLTVFSLFLVLCFVF